MNLNHSLNRFNFAQSRISYQYLRKTLRLTMEDISEQNPSDIAYVHSGYAPLSVRLVDYLSTGKWKTCEDAISALPGPLIDEFQQLPAGMGKDKRKSSLVNSVRNEVN
jgi:hypothetical protein